MILKKCVRDLQHDDIITFGFKNQLKEVITSIQNVQNRFVPAFLSKQLLQKYAIW